jgi:inorganic triphosphatase YgiF
MSMTSMVEREVKLGVWPGFRIPELDGVFDGMTVVAEAVSRLDASYHDTPDLRLARSGVTLRQRSPEGWTLKLPTGEGKGAMLSRRELTVAGDDMTVPVELANLVVAWVRTSTLGPVARLHTVRHSVKLVDHLGGRGRAGRSHPQGHAGARSACS